MARTNEINEMLMRRDFTGAVTLAGGPAKAIRLLISYAYNDDVLLRGRAFEMLAVAAAERASEDIEDVREIIRRLLWSMNDESGGIGWHAAEAAGEILAAVPSLIAEFGIIVSWFMNQPPFERSAHAAVARMTAVRPDVFTEIRNELASSLKSSDPAIRAFSASALVSIGGDEKPQLASRLADDLAEFEYYDRDAGNIVRSRVGMYVMKMINKLERL